MITNHPIASAPRDRAIILGDPETGEFIMRWNPRGANLLVQDSLGIWEAIDGSFTWSDADGAGPSYWRNLNS